MSWNHPARSVLVLTVLTVLLAASGVVMAAQVAEQNDKYEIPLREFDLFNHHSPAAELARQQTENEFGTAYGGAWKVYSWNPQTGTPKAVYGSGAKVAAPFQTANDVLAAGRAVLQRVPSALKADLTNLRFDAAPRGVGKWAVHFQQTYHAIDVWGGRVSLTFTDQGRLFVAGSEYYPEITVDWRPSLTAEMAKEVARRDLPFRDGADFVEEGARLLVLPVPLSETQVEYHLVWRVRVHTGDPLGVWVTHVDAHDGKIVWRYNDVHFADFTGDATSMDQRPSYCEGQTLEAAPYLRIQIAGLTSVYADVNGNWTVPYIGSDSKTLTADLYSPYVDLDNLGGAEGTFTGTATPGVPLTVAFTDLNSQRDEKDVYRAVNDIHTFFQTVAPEFNYTNQRIIAHVRRPGTCNAYWDGSINFYAQGGGCANTGEIMGVVHHEYGHGIQNAILGQQGSQGLGEGNGDIIANLMTMESIIGRGFYLNQCTTGIRDSRNGLRYPGDVIGQEIHYAGQVIAGFHWDAMQALIVQIGAEQGRLVTARTWHYGRLLERPLTQPDQVLATFIADDDDGDLTNGTPHYDAFCLGATNHGFSCPEILTGVIIQHTPLASRTTPGDAVAVATIYSTEGPLVADSLRLNYRLNGGAFQFVLMTPTGAMNEFRGIIPDLQSPAEVEYYIRARDVAGNTRTSPPLAPSVLHAFDVATVYDNLEADSGWTVNLEGTDNAATGVWVRVDPNGTSAQPEDDHTPEPGTVCWVTGNANPGDPAGTNDVDSGTTTLYSPTYDLTGASTASAKFWRWYSNDRGGAPGLDTWLVQVRNNGGAWVNVENTTVSSNAWVVRTYDLKGTFGGSLGGVQFKFVASDLADPSLIEAAVDDFEILASMSSDVETPVLVPARFALLGGRPNPVHDGTVIGFQVPSRAQVRLSLYDVAGRLVRTLADRTFDPGVHSVAWDGVDAQGHPAASGVYFYRMQSEGFNASRTLVLNR